MNFFNKMKGGKSSPPAVNLSEIICEGGDGAKKRMREFKVRGNISAKDQHDHEVIQRAYVESAGPVPSGTNLMTILNI